MARPKKEAAEGKTVMVNYNDYMNMQNFLAQHLQVQHSMASRLVTAASSQLGAINATLHQVQGNTRNALNMSSIDESSINPQTHGYILHLLQTDNALVAEPVEGLSELQLPSAPPQPKQLKKKQRKPKDPNAPKRPVTAFFLYLAENKDIMAKQLGPNAKPGEIQQRNKEMWNSLTEQQQEKYKSKYRDNFEQYKEALRAYAASQGTAIDPRMLNPDPAHPAAVEEKEDAEEEEEESSDEDEAPPAPVPEPPKKVTKKAAAAAAAAAAPAKDAGPEKKKKAEPKKKATKAAAAPPPAPEKSTSPEVPKKKRKSAAIEPEPAAPASDKKGSKKKRKSAGYAGNTEDY